MIKLIIATDLYGGIGYLNKLPWNIPNELKLFNKITQNATLLMGLNTYLSLPSSFDLKNRKIIVLSKYIDFPKHIKINQILNTQEQINNLFLNIEKIKKIYLFVGKSVYEQFYNKANIIIISVINNIYKTDTKISFINKNKLIDENIIYKDKDFITYQYELN
ncbi:dihydrofolate reductase [Mycoplasmopsis felis]|uniref:dihydrofolate reductase n=1 Tax=Mycoplasmopsis felis TaxID=33923 RepID=UPI0021E0EB65|nr:dihydrofolate reductase [Mycoplasmopsis felis]MCU9932228.1 dihydrofolate reductase [Mycoplasmopsis felis]